MKKYSTKTGIIPIDKKYQNGLSLKPSLVCLFRFYVVITQSINIKLCTHAVRDMEKDTFYREGMRTSGVVVENNILNIYI